MAQHHILGCSVISTSGFLKIRCLMTRITTNRNSWPEFPDPLQKGIPLKLMLKISVCCHFGYRYIFLFVSTAAWLLREVGSKNPDFTQTSCVRGPGWSIVFWSDWQGRSGMNWSNEGSHSRHEWYMGSFGKSVETPYAASVSMVWLYSITTYENIIRRPGNNLFWAL